MNHRSRPMLWSLFFGASALVGACSSSPSDSNAMNGGTTNAAGANAHATSGSGGSPASGGLATGGAISGSAGSPPVGGSSAGGNVASGGTVASGGSAGLGGAGAGGSVPSGGSAGSGGRPSGGAAGIAGGGASATGGQATAGSAGAAEFQPCPASGVCKVMPLGDSITDGTGFSGGYRVELFAKAIADKKNITFVGSLSNGPNTVSGVSFPKSHEGHFGWTIKQVDDLIPDPALNPAPHIVLLHLGTNDINQGMTSGAPERLGSLIDQIISKLPNALIVVAKIIPEPSKASDITSFNNAVPQVVQSRANAGKHVILVDQFTGFPSSELGDGVHPNQAGYSRMAGVWYPAIKAYLH